MRFLLFFFSFSFFSFNAFAAAPSFDNIDSGDFEKLNREFATNFLHTTVSPASSSTIFGVEVGLVGGVTETPDIEKFTKEIDPSANISAIPHGYIFATLEIPMGLSFDLALLPETELGDSDIEHLGIGVKWNFLSVAILNMAAKAHFSKSSINFDQTISNVRSQVAIEQDSWGVDILASANLVFVEPYAGVGFVSSSSSIGSNASTSIFDTTFSQGSTAKDDYSSVKFLAGVQFNLLLLHVGLEYMNVYEKSRFSGKLSLYF